MKLRVTEVQPRMSPLTAINIISHKGSVFIIHEVCLCWPTDYLLTLTCNPQTHALTIVHGHVEWPDMCHLLYVFSPEAEPGATLPSCFNSYPVNMCPIHGPIGATFSAFTCSFLVISVFKMVLKPELQGLLVFLRKKKKGSICFTNKMNV